MASVLRRAFLQFMVAVAVAMLTAVPLANASRFDRVADMNRPATERGTVLVTGLIAFGLTLALAGPAMRGGLAVIATLRRVQTKPRTGAAITLVACGTTLILSSLYIGWLPGAASSMAGLQRSMQELQGQLNAMPLPGEVAVSLPSIPNLGGSASSGGAVILPVVVFLVGLGLTGLGVWAMIPAGPPLKHPIPASDATSL